MDDSSISGAVEAIYALPSDPTSWTAVSDQLGRILQGESVIFLHDYESARIRPLALRGVDAGGIDEYQSRFAGRNPIVPRALTRPEGTSNAVESLIDRSAFDKSIYYNEWFRPRGFHHSTGLRLTVNDTSSLFLTFFRGQRDGEYSQESQQLLERLVPYLRQSIQIALRLEQMTATVNELQHALSGMGTSVFQIDRRGAILEANSSAQQLLETEPALRVMNGRLTLTSEERLLLSQHIRRAIDGHCQERFTIASRGSAKRYNATLIRSQPQSVWLSEPTALLLIDTPRPLSPPQDLEQAYNLTPAESRLLSALAMGESVNDFCGRTGVSRNTVKTQLSHLFAKTGTSKQKDLVRIALRM